MPLDELINLICFYSVPLRRKKCVHANACLLGHRMHKFDKYSKKQLTPNTFLENKYMSESDQSPSLNKWHFHIWKPLPEMKPIKEHKNTFPSFCFRFLLSPLFRKAKITEQILQQNFHYLNFHNTTKQATSHMHYTNANTTPMLST